METEGAASAMDQASHASQPTQRTASNTAQILRFLKFPRELRDKIYRFVLVYDCALVPSKHPLVGRPIDLGLLCANRQISEEARYVFLKEKGFQYQEDWERERDSRYFTFNAPRYLQHRRILYTKTLKQARKIRAQFGSEINSNDLIAEFPQLLVQNPNLTSLNLSFHETTDSLLIKCEEALPLLEKIKVRDRVVINFRPRPRSRLGISKRAKKCCEKLKVLEEIMLAK